jgi:hypothetical protein
MRKPFTGPGPGRPKGSTNRVSKAIKEMVIGALNEAGGQAYLAQQAKANPVAFMTLIGKVMPLQVTGEDGGAIMIVTGVDRGENHD